MTSIRFRLRQSLVMACLFGIAGGLISSLAYPDNAIWLAIFPAVALILYAITIVSVRQSLLVGFLAGLSFYASQIPWMTVYLGPIPWLALSVLEGAIFAAGSWAIAFAVSKYRSQRRTFFSTVNFALAVASLWTAREWVACNLPYGGFPWSRVSLSQSNSPLAPWVFWGGDSLLSFVLVFATAILVFGWRELRITAWRSSATMLALVGVFVVPVVTPLSIEAETGTLKVAAVQGNAKAGLLVAQAPGTILKNHLDASEQLLSQAQKPELVIWPENAADLNPLENADSRWQITNFVNRVNAPLMFGTITERGNDIYNSSILWQPKLGPTDWYDKKRPVAFGEFVPDRAFWHILAPDLIDLIPRGYTFGTRDGIFEIPKTKVGTMICFEVAVDDISRDLVHQGATLLIAQTNNSDFGTTNESTQQLAIARLRAIETGRAFVNISTVGTSAIILPNGVIAQQLPTYKAALMQQELPLRTSLTPAMLIGSSLEIANNFSALAQLVFLMILQFRQRRRGNSID